MFPRDTLLKYVNLYKGEILRNIRIISCQLYINPPAFMKYWLSGP